MAKKSKSVLPLAAETRDEVVRIVRDSAEPLTAKAISTALVAPHVGTEAQLIPVLQDQVAAGMLFETPPATAKGKPRYWHSDLNVLCRDAIFAAVKNSQKPVTATEIAGQLNLPVKLTSTNVTSLLDQLVANDAIKSLPPEKPTGKSRYWDRDLAALGRSLVIEAMTRVSLPITAKELAGLLVSAVKFSEADLAPILEAYVSEGKFHVFAPAKAGGKSRYWDRDLQEIGRQELVKTLQTKGPQTQATLKKGAKGLSPDQFQTVFQELLGRGTIYLHPPLPSSKQEFYGVHPPIAEPYLKDLGQQLGKIVGTLTAAKVPREDLRRALVQLIESTGITFGSTASTSPPPVQITAEVDLIELLKRIEPGAERGALVGARELRRGANLGKAEFDSAVLDLARQGKLSLHRHDFAASLTPAERDELVTDGAGTYYIGMAIRQNVS